MLVQGKPSRLTREISCEDASESTTPPLRVRDLADPADLADLALGYGTSRGDEELRAVIAAVPTCCADTTPLAFTLAIAELLLAHVNV